MGNKISKKNKYKLPDRVKIFSICTLDLKLNKLIDYNEKIDNLFSFIIDNKYDIICLQGLNNKNLYDKLQNTLHFYNDKKNIYFYPKLNNIKNLFETSQRNLSEHSVSVEDEISGDSIINHMDSIIISKYEILSSAPIEIPSYICTSDSTWYIMNIMFYNKIISIFSIKLQQDYIGVSNHRIRARQVEILRDSIIMNQAHIKNDLCITEENFTIISIQSNINNFKNNDLNKEYENLLSSIESIDTHDYIQKIKNGANQIKKNDIHNVRSNYILLSLINRNIYNHHFNPLIKNRSENIAIRNSIIEIDKNILGANPMITDFFIKIKNNDPFQNDDIIETTQNI